MRVDLEPHPSLDARAFVTRFSVSLGQSPSPPWLVAQLAPAAPAPFAEDASVRPQIRDVLRHGGYKPTGRGKPASAQAKGS